MGRRQRESTPAGYIWTGVAVAVLTGLLSGLAGFGSDSPGVLIAVAGGVIAQVLIGIGVVAKGIQVGTRNSD